MAPDYGRMGHTEAEGREGDAANQHHHVCFMDSLSTDSRGLTSGTHTTLLSVPPPVSTHVSPRLPFFAKPRLPGTVGSGLVTAQVVNVNVPEEKVGDFAKAQRSALDSGALIHEYNSEWLWQIGWGMFTVFLLGRT